MTVLNDKALKEAVEHGLVSGMIDPAVQIQPNGIEMTVGKVEKYNSMGYIGFDNKSRTLPSTSEIEPHSYVSGDWLQLESGCYLLTLNEAVKIPKNCMALAVPRSSLLRMGVDIRSAAWDSGYEGRSQVMMVVNNPYGVMLQKNARILQLIFFKLNDEVEKGYSGIYQRENL